MMPSLAGQLIIPALLMAQSVRLLREQLSTKRRMQKAVGRVHVAESPVIAIRAHMAEARQQAAAAAAGNVDHHASAGGIYGRQRRRPITTAYDPNIPMPGSTDPVEMDDMALRWARRPERKWS